MTNDPSPISSISIFVSGGSLFINHSLRNIRPTFIQWRKNGVRRSLRNLINKEKFTSYNPYNNNDNNIHM